MITFSQYITESYEMLDEKLGNLNASTDPKYKFLLKSVLKNKYYRGNIGPNSKVIQVSGTGNKNFLKDLQDSFKKIGAFALCYLTVHNSTYMVLLGNNEVYDDELGSYKQRPISRSTNIQYVHVAQPSSWQLENGPILPQAEIESNILSAKGRRVYLKLSDLFNKSSFEDDTNYHAIVVFDDLKAAQKAIDKSREFSSGKRDKYAPSYQDNSSSEFMSAARRRAGILRASRQSSDITTGNVSFANLMEFIVDLGNNKYITVDGVRFEIYHNYVKPLGNNALFSIDKSGWSDICMLTKINDDGTKSYDKYTHLTYNFETNVLNFK